MVRRELYNQMKYLAPRFYGGSDKTTLAAALYLIRTYQELDHLLVLPNQSIPVIFFSHAQELIESLEKNVLNILSEKSEAGDYSGLPVYWHYYLEPCPNPKEIQVFGVAHTSTLDIFTVNVLSNWCDLPSEFQLAK